MNFSDLEQSVNKIASFFKLNVKLINLNDSKHKQIIEKIQKNPNEQLFDDSDTEEEVEDIFQPNEKYSKKKQSIHSEKKEKIRSELDYLNKERSKLEQLMSNVNISNFNQENKDSFEESSDEDTPKKSIENNIYISNKKSDSNESSEDYKTLAKNIMKL